MSFSPVKCATFIALLALLVLPAAALAQSGEIQVYSTPADAYVCIDNAQCGHTPEDFFVTGDAYHTVAVSLDGYQTWTQYVRVSAGATEVINANLAPDVSPTALPTPAPVADTGSGTVRVYVSPAGGMVCLDVRDCEVNVGGTSQTGTGTTDFTAVKAGAVHTIDVTNDGYAPYTTQVTVLPDQVNEVDVTLQPLATETPVPVSTTTKPTAIPTTKAGLGPVPVIGALALCGAIVLCRKN